MKAVRQLWICALWIVFPMLTTNANAQGCRTDYYFNYAVYFSGSSDGTNIYTSVLTDGSATGNPGPGCNYPSSTHTASSYNKIGSTGGWQSETPQPMGSYLSIQNNQQAPVGSDQAFEYQGQVICSVFGSIFFSSFSGTVGYSVGNFVNSGPGGIYAPNGCLFKLACPNGTTSKCAPSSVSAQQSLCSAPYDHEWYLTWTPTGKATECFAPNVGSTANYEINCR